MVSYPKLRRMKRKNRKNKQVIAEMISNVEPSMIPQVQKSKAGGWQGTYSEEQLNEIALKFTKESDGTESYQDTSILAVKREVRGRSRDMIGVQQYLAMTSSSSPTKALATSWSHPPRDITVTRPMRRHSDRSFNKSGTAMNYKEASLRHPYSSSASVDPPDYNEELLIRQARRSNLPNNSLNSSLSSMIGCDPSFSSSKDQILPSTIGHKGDQKLTSSTRSVELAYRNERKNITAKHQSMDTTSFTAPLTASKEHDHEYHEYVPCETLTLSPSSSIHSDEKMHNQLMSNKMMFHTRPRSPHPVDILRGGIGTQQSQSASINRCSPSVSLMQEKSLTSATWHPVSNGRIKSSSDVLNQYIDYLHSSKVEAESKLARLKTEFNLLSIEFERLKRCFVNAVDDNADTDFV